MAVGICRVPNSWVTQDGVKVQYVDGMVMEIPADQYKAQGYRPTIEALPLRPETGTKDVKKTKRT